MSTRQATVEVEVEVTWTSREVVQLPADAAADGSPYVTMAMAREFSPHWAQPSDIEVVNVRG